MKVYLAQLKCPANHGVLALAGAYESLEAAPIYATIEEARPWLKACEEEQKASAEAFRAARN